MINCPECGQGAEEGTKFCERCGQGLSVSRPPAQGLDPLAPGTQLKRGYKIIELIAQSSEENRYRASRETDGGTEIVQIRERDTGTQAGEAQRDDAEAPTPPTPPTPAPVSTEDPNGPRAKTRELTLSGGEQAAGETTALLSTDESTTTASTAESESTTEPAADAIDASQNGGPEAAEGSPQPEESAEPDDLGEVFGRVMGLSLTLDHPAFHRAFEGFADRGRVYLAYKDEPLKPLSQRTGGLKMSESEALNVAVQVCQAVFFLHKRALRLNDICPTSLAYGADGRIKILGLEYVSNDNELQSEPIFNDGYTAPEIYRGKAADKRADLFSIGCLFYSCLTGERLDSETWREEAGSVVFYPPHVVTPELEQAVRRAVCFKPSERWPSADALKAELLRINGSFGVRSGAMTDVGMVREHNEDSILVLEYLRDSQVEPARSFIYVVSDGMGGAEAGETASAIAIATIRSYVEQALGQDVASDRSKVLQEALEEANRKIIEYQAANPESRGMGATAVAALIVPPDGAIAWVGDSRIYLLERGQLRQITKDHSLVQRLVEIGQITAEEARHHEHKNVITRSLGARQSGPAGAETMALRLKRGDRLMLCSDGLTAHLDDGQIREILSRHSDPHQAARELVVAANAGGGSDNISVIAVYAE